MVLRSLCNARSQKHYSTYHLHLPCKFSLLAHSSPSSRYQMADTHTSSAAASGRTSITLHVVSPSSPRITFENISIATTVLELKTKISETASTHPQVGTQRLIYRGHPVVQGERTLRDIFGQQTVASILQSYAASTNTILDRSER